MQLQHRVWRTQLVEDRGRAVVGPVVDDDDLVAVVGVVEREQRGYEALDDELLVATGDHHGDERVIAPVEAGAAAHVPGCRRERRNGEGEVAEQEDEEQHGEEHHDDEARAGGAEQPEEQHGEAGEEQQRPRRAGGSLVRLRVAANGCRRRGRADRTGPLGQRGHERLRMRKVRQNSRKPSRAVTPTMATTGPQSATELLAGVAWQAWPGVRTLTPSSVHVTGPGASMAKTLIFVPDWNVVGWPRSAGPGEKPLLSPTPSVRFGPVLL